MTLLALILWNGAALWALFTLLWILSLVLQDASIVDPVWGPGYVMVVWLSLLLADGAIGPRQVLVAVLVTVWGLRLGLHIFGRNRGRGEDPRYAKWRTEEGERWWWYSYLKVFLLQAFLAWLVSTPLAVAQYSRGHGALMWLDWLALVVWLVGFGFEAGGDLQLGRFKANPKNRGKVLDRGFWRYTRHPNYFGDATQWWAYFLIAAAAGGWWAVFSPVLMTWLLMRVSGVALLERSLMETKPQYREYIEATSAFFPWPRRKRG